MIDIFPIELIENIFGYIEDDLILKLRVISKQWNLFITSRTSCDIIISGSIKSIKNIKYYERNINFNNRNGFINVENLLIEKPFLYNIQNLEYIIKKIYKTFNINRIFLNLEIYNCLLSGDCMKLIFNETNNTIHINSNILIKLEKLNVYNKNIKELFINKSDYIISNFPNLNILGFSYNYQINNIMIKKMIKLIKINNIRKVKINFYNINLNTLEKCLLELDSLICIDLILINEHKLCLKKYKKVKIN